MSCHRWCHGQFNTSKEDGDGKRCYFISIGGGVREDDSIWWGQWRAWGYLEEGWKGRWAVKVGCGQAWVWRHQEGQCPILLATVGTLVFALSSVRKHCRIWNMEAAGYMFSKVHLLRRSNSDGQRDPEPGLKLKFSDSWSRALPTQVHSCSPDPGLLALLFLLWFCYFNWMYWGDTG